MRRWRRLPMMGNRVDAFASFFVELLDWNVLCIFLCIFFDLISRIFHHFRKKGGILEIPGGSSIEQIMVGYNSKL